MKKEIAKLWVKALRSGKYKQTKSRLADGEGGFCCLGVLCDLHARAYPEVAKLQNDPRSYLGEEHGLPSAVQVWAGMCDEVGSYSRVRAGSYLANDNDAGETFSSIAKIIEKNVEAL